MTLGAHRYVSRDVADDGVGLLDEAETTSKLCGAEVVEAVDIVSMK